MCFDYTARMIGRMGAVFSVLMVAAMVTAYGNEF